jgi:RHS repeat-associated protein
VGAPEVRYRHGDRLNSLDAATDSSGKEMPADLHGYDAFGKPRGYDWHANPGAAFERLHASEFGVTTNNGFTTHEHLDEVYLIHMNGRVYDYRLGRFLSVDPIISNPANSQSINPYSYIGNNPLSGVDPTGYACVPVTGSHICYTSNNLDEALSAYVSIGTRITQVNPPSSGARAAGTRVAQSSPSEAQSPTQVAQQGLTSTMEKFKDLRRQLENVRRLIEVATSAGAGGLVGLAQGQIPFGGLYKPELGMDSGSYELGRGLGMLIGGIETTLTGGKLLAAGGAGELTLGGTGVGALGSGVLVVGGVVFTAGGAVNVLEALKATSNGWSMMKNSGDGGTTPSPALPDSPYNPDVVAARVRPEYRGNPAHDPQSPLFNPRKTPEPPDAASVYGSAGRANMYTWYGRGKGGWYRYFSDNSGGAHFSGIVPEAEVPTGVRRGR